MADIIDFGAYRDPADMNKAELLAYLETLRRQIAELDEAGGLITDENRKTSVEGVYGAGDVCAKSLRQVVTATADGALAAASLEQYAAAMHRKINAQPL